MTRAAERLSHRSLLVFFLGGAHAGCRCRARNHGGRICNSASGGRDHTTKRRRGAHASSQTRGRKVTSRTGSSRTRSRAAESSSAHAYALARQSPLQSQARRLRSALEPAACPGKELAAPPSAPRHVEIGPAISSPLQVCSRRSLVYVSLMFIDSRPRDLGHAAIEAIGSSDAKA
jgi:hypothetical protein